MPRFDPRPNPLRDARELLFTLFAHDTNLTRKQRNAIVFVIAYLDVQAGQEVEPEIVHTVR